MDATRLLLQHAYWDTRYAQEKKYRGAGCTFDWLATFKPLWNTMGNYLPSLQDLKAKRILVLGCGTSMLTEELYKIGLPHITSIDISAVLIHDLQERYISTMEGVEFLVMDMRKMDAFQNASFDIVIDKGSIDTLFAGHSFMTDIPMTLQEIHRILVPGGIFFCVSHGSVQGRSLYFGHTKLRWRVESSPIVGAADVMLFVMTKSPQQEGGSPLEHVIEDKAAARGGAGQPGAHMSRSRVASFIRKKRKMGQLLLTGLRDSLDTVDLSSDVAFILPVRK